MPSTWLIDLAWAALAVAFASTAWIAVDIFARGYRQKMRVMEAVWPVTGLYFGPAAVWGYLRYGRPKSNKWLAEQGLDEPPDKPGWAATATGISHCGAGCTLGDIISEFAIFGLGVTLAGETVFAEYLGDYVLAVALGLAFQYFAIAPMRGLSFGKGIVAAAKADILSLSAFEVGLFGWMALMAFVFFPAPHHIHPDARVLVPHADWHDHRLLHRLAGQHLADPQRNQRGDVIGDPESLGGKRSPTLRRLQVRAQPQRAA